MEAEDDVICQEHWDKLRAAIEDRGLSHMVAPDGQTAAAQMADQVSRIEEGQKTSITLANYDPLITAMWAIHTNAARLVELAGAGQGVSLYLLTDGPLDPVEGLRRAAPGAMWPRCPICYLNLAHRLTCTNPRCKLDKEQGYEFYIDRAADDQVEIYRRLTEKAGKEDESA